MMNIYQHIETRITNLEVLLPEYLTPLLRKQIQHAIKLHREALKHPDPYLKDLDTLYNQFNEHWTKVYGDSISRAILLRDIILFHQFLVERLLEDYTNKPCTIGKWVLDQAKCITEQEDRTGAKDGNDVDTAYSVHVIYPLEEMMLSRDYVEKKLRAAGQGRRGGDIQFLIDRRDWSNLAAALINDRDLADTLYQQQPFNTNVFDAGTYEEILKCIDEIKGKYFVNLSDQSTFTISSYAKGTPAGQASRQTKHTSPPNLRTNDRHNPLDSTSKGGFAWNIYKFASGYVRTKSNVKFRSPPPPSDTANSPLISKKAD